MYRGMDVKARSCRSALQDRGLALLCLPTLQECYLNFRILYISYSHLVRVGISAEQIMLRGSAAGLPFCAQAKTSNALQSRSDQQWSWVLSHDAETGSSQRSLRLSSRIVARSAREVEKDLCYVLNVLRI